MRIAYLLPDPGIPVGGTKGASVHVSSLCSAMAAQGAEVTLFAPKVVGEAPKGTRLVHIDMGSVAKGHKGEIDRLRGLASFYSQVRAHLEADLPDVIHERLSLFADGGSLAETLQIGRLVEVNAPVADERAAHFGLVGVDEAEQAERRSLHGASVVAVSEPLVRWSLSKGAARATMIPNGADTAALDPLRWITKADATRTALGLASLPVIGFTGSLKPWHGVDVLFDALEILGESRSLGALIVGDGPGRTSLEARAEGLPDRIRTVFTGSVPQERVPEYISVADIAVAPYLPVEPFYFSPLKVAEAMAAGLPVVASDFDSVRELLADTGITVPSGDAQALAAALGRLLDDDTLRYTLGGAARKRAADVLDWKAVAARTLAEAEHAALRVRLPASEGAL